jgi:hypothetical protein
MMYNQIQWVVDFSPFEPVIKKTDIQRRHFAVDLWWQRPNVHARKSIRIWVQSNTLPCNVKFMIEGEEEIGSKSLSWFVERNQEKT